jgi:hypothetical protein
MTGCICSDEYNASLLSRKPLNEFTFEMVREAVLSSVAEHGSNGEKSEKGEVINFESVRAGLKF